MAAFLKVARTLRNHWKKSTFAAVLSVWGGKYLYERYQADLLREEYCKQAQLYGQKLTATTAKPVKVTVFLNPAARKGKAKKLFQKNAAPLLHLAGLDVDIIQTSVEGEAKELAKSLDKTDLIVIAGGDGTVAEVVTGLLRREDQQVVSASWPLGIIPVGATNTLAKILYSDAEADVRWMCNAAMAIIKGMTRPVDVMSVQDEEKGRRSYAVSSLCWGPLQDAKEKSTKFWYFGPLKQRVSYLWASVSQEFPPVIHGHIAYGPPKEIPEPPPPIYRSWWTRLLNRLWPKRQEPEPEVVESDVEEELEEMDISNIELAIVTDNGTITKEGPPALNLKLGPQECSRTDFIKEGWARVRGDEHSETYSMSSIPAGKISLRPETKEGETSWFTIDNERFEAMAVSINLLPSKLRFFTDHEKSSEIRDGQSQR